MSNEWYLEPKNENSKSFYNKAKVVVEENALALISYKSCICRIRNCGFDDATVTIYDIQDYYGKSLTFSNTSIRHLKEFLKQNGFEASTKAQILKDYEIIEMGNTDAQPAGVKYRRTI